MNLSFLGLDRATVGKVLGIQQAKVLVLEEPTVQQRRQVHEWAVLRQSGSADTERHSSAYMWYPK